jgi:hypothetical protein
LSHLWQRFLLASALFLGVLIGIGVANFGYDNPTRVDVYWAVFHLHGVPLWTVVVIPVALVLATGTLFHWLNGLHHFTEHMRHRRRVHELEAEIASVRAHLDHVLEMPSMAGNKRTERKEPPAPATATNSDLGDVAGAEPEPPRAEAAPTTDEVPAAAPAPVSKRSGKRVSLAPEEAPVPEA